MEKDDTKQETKETTETRVELSEEAKSLIERQNEEIAKLQEQVRANTVKDRIDELKKMGFSEFPGFLVEVEKILLADDGAEALLLSEEVEGSQKTVTITATQIVDRLVGALPIEGGKLKLGEQAISLGPADVKPEADTSQEIPHSDKVAAAAEWLGGTVAIQHQKGGE